MDVPTIECRIGNRRGRQPYESVGLTGRTLLVPRGNASIGCWLKFFPEQTFSSAQRILRALLDPAERAFHKLPAIPFMSGISDHWDQRWSPRLKKE